MEIVLVISVSVHSEPEGPRPGGDYFVKHFFRYCAKSLGFNRIGGSGTGSRGQTIDINFTIERLDKAMKKKSEHDQYINKLGDEYAEIKSVWSKLSVETDRL